MKGRQPNEIDDVIAKLSSRDVYFSHGSVIDHVEAANLGLKIEYLKPDRPDLAAHLAAFSACMSTTVEKLAISRSSRGNTEARPSLYRHLRSRQGHHDFPDADLAARDGLTVERRSGNLLCQ